MAKYIRRKELEAEVDRLKKRVNSLRALVKKAAGHLLYDDEYVRDYLMNRIGDRAK